MKITTILVPCCLITVAACLLAALPNGVSAPDPAIKNIVEVLSNPPLNKIIDDAFAKLDANPQNDLNARLQVLIDDLQSGRKMIVDADSVVMFCRTHPDVGTGVAP